MRNAILLVTVCALFAPATWAEDASKPASAKGPLVLADFEQPESIALWTGLRCEQTDAHVSAGKCGMRFTIPKWEKGTSEWPAVCLAFADGKGYQTKDWSRYGKLAFDAWVEGDKPARLLIELREKKGHSGCASSFVIEPERPNHIEMPLPDAAGVGVNLKGIEEIALFASRPPAAFTVTIGCVRLLPADKPPIAEFDLVYPNYRQMVFPGAGDIEVAVTAHAEDHGLKPGQLALRLSLRAGEEKASLERILAQGEARFSLPAGRLPPGPAVLSAAVLKTADGATLASQEWQIQMLAPDAVTRLKVYIDRNNNTIVDGKPFFPLGWYGKPDEEHLAEIADSPFNCILDYGTNHKPKAWMLKYLDAMHKKGLKLVYCLNDVYPTATYFDKDSWEGIKGNDAIADAVIKAYRDHPAILAWYLNDELPRTLVPRLEDYYDRVKDADPNHPCYIVLCNMAEVKYFPHTTDIMGVDPYPIPRKPVTMVSQCTDTANRAVNDHKPAWLVPQAFAWYQYNPKGANRARTPTGQELKAGRAPTYEEGRCMTYLALAHGAKGLIYYCYYDLRVLPQYARMWTWMKKIGGEVKTLSPALLSPEDLGAVSFSPPDAPIHTRLKRHEGKLYLIAVNAASTPCRATFDLKRKLAPQAIVMFEDRTLTTDGSRLTAEFKPLEVHVFEFGPVAEA